MILDNDLQSNDEYQILKEEKAHATRTINYGFLMQIFLILQSIYSMFVLYNMFEYAKGLFMIAAGILVIYIGCFVYALKKPKEGMMASIIALITVYIVSSMVYPGNILLGLLLQLLIVGVLLRAHKAADRLQEIEFQMERLSKRLAREKNG